MQAVRSDGSSAQFSHVGLALCGSACLHCALCARTGVAYMKCFRAVFEVIVYHNAQHTFEEALRGPETLCFL